MAVSSAQKIMCLMSNNKTFLTYIVDFCGKSYRIKLGHLDEFVALFQDSLEVDEMTIFGLAWDTLDKYTHPYEWYRRV